MFIYEEDEELGIYSDLMSFKNSPGDSPAKKEDDLLNILAERVRLLENENKTLAYEVNQLKTYLKSIVDSMSSNSVNHPLYRK